MESFWDILWLYVGQTWGPNWHPMHTGYANLGPCVRREEREPHVRDVHSEPSPIHPNSPTRFDQLLTVLALTLWSLVEAAPDTQETPSLEYIAPSACWPPMAARLRPWDTTRSERQTYGGDVPPVIWETGYDHHLRPLARWALQWRLRLLPQMSFLGALPESKKEALRTWAWPGISTTQWQNLWDQMRTGNSPLPNLLPLSLWVGHIRTPPFSLNALPWDGTRGPSFSVPRGTWQMWTLLGPAGIAQWTKTLFVLEWEALEPNL